MSARKTAAIALVAGFIGAAVAIGLAATFASQRLAYRVLVLQEDSIPSIVSSLSALRALGERDARYQLESVLDHALQDRMWALEKEPLWLLPNPYPGLEYKQVPDKFLDRYFAESPDDITQFSEADSAFLWRRNAYLELRELTIDKYADALEIAVACEQRSWWIKVNACPSWSDSKRDYNPDHETYMRIDFASAPQGSSVFSVAAQDQGLSVRYVGSAELIEDVIWAEYQLDDGRKGFLPHTTLARRPTLLAKLLW